MAESMAIYLYETSDVHSHILNKDYITKEETNYALAKVSTLIKQKRSEHEHVLLVDNGDYLQGSPLASYIALRSQPATPAPLVEAMNLVRYNAMILGNHEFNFGQDFLRKAIDLLDCQVLGANIVDLEGNCAFGKPYEIFTFGEVKIGLLGLVTDFVPQWELPEHIEGLRFLDPIETAQYWIPKIKAEADAVIVSYHGGPDRDLKTGEVVGLPTGENAALDLIDEVEGIDALLCGHQHRLLNDRYKGVPLVQPGWRGSHVAELKINFIKKEQGYILESIDTNLLSVESYDADPKIVETIAPWRDRVEEWLDQSLGFASEDLVIHDIVHACCHNHPYLDFVNTIQMVNTGADLSATSLFGLKAKGLGPIIKVRDVVNNYVYSNTLDVLRISGADLKEALEKCASFFTILNGKIAFRVAKEQSFIPLYNYDVYKGVTYTFDIRKPIGERVVELKFKGKDVQNTDRFTLALNSYRAIGGGGYGMYKPNKIIKKIHQDMVDLMISYIRENPIIFDQAEASFQVIGAEE